MKAAPGGRASEPAPQYVGNSPTKGCLDVRQLARLSVFLLAAVTGCAAPTSTASLPARSPTLGSGSNASGTFAVLYRFQGGLDGSNPVAKMIYANGALYGTTANGGIANSGGFGTVFQVSLSGKESTIYRFAGGSDGEYPQGGLVDIGGVLYGTTYGGGAYGNGTIFSVTPSGTEHVIYSFKGNGDGSNPSTDLIDVNGTLFGTTTSGGADDGSGAVFSSTTSGSETAVYVFNGAPGGSPPTGQWGLQYSNGELFGTFQTFGADSSTYTVPGAVFALTTSGTGRILYTFPSDAHYYHSKNGAIPVAGVTPVGSRLFGTTKYGGSKCEHTKVYRGGCGTIFIVNASDNERVLYSFKGGSGDGNGPVAGLVYDGGTLYGTTALGGPARAECTSGCGTVFAISTTGGERVLHFFRGGEFGTDPVSTLTEVDGKLYGTTAKGGTSDHGIIFRVTP